MLGPPLVNPSHLWWKIPSRCLSQGLRIKAVHPFSKCAFVIWSLVRCQIILVSVKLSSSLHNIIQTLWRQQRNYCRLYVVFVFQKVGLPLCLSTLSVMDVGSMMRLVLGIQLQGQVARWLLVLISHYLRQGRHCVGCQSAETKSS